MRDRDREMFFLGRDEVRGAEMVENELALSQKKKKMKLLSKYSFPTHQTILMRQRKKNEENKEFEIKTRHY